MSDDERDRDRIAECARAVLTRTAWRHLKIRTVIREADVSARRFYDLFANEDDLALFLVEQEFELLRRTLVSALSTPPAGWSSIVRFVDVYLNLFLAPDFDDRRRYYHAHMSGEGARRRFTRMRDQVVRPLELAFLAAQAGGEIHVADPAADARRTYNLLEGLVYFLLWANREEDAAAITSSVHSFVFRALGVGPAPAAAAGSSPGTVFHR